jgi:transcriptional regulator with XRE-family HTH domain
MARGGRRRSTGPGRRPAPRRAPPVEKFRGLSVHASVMAERTDEGEQMETEFDWQQMEGWSAEEVEWYLMGPFDGGIPGTVRRVRRVLDVSQRGLAALLGVSQSVVARWETGRTSPRASVLQHLLRLAGLGSRMTDIETGEEVEPMRDDGHATGADVASRPTWTSPSRAGGALAAWSPRPTSCGGVVNPAGGGRRGSCSTRRCGTSTDSSTAHRWTTPRTSSSWRRLSTSTRSGKGDVDASWRSGRGSARRPTG